MNFQMIEIALYDNIVDLNSKRTFCPWTEFFCLKIRTILNFADFDLGKNFLGSWKSMSMTDDAMDLDFVSVSKGMKKAFNFDKV